MFIKIGQRRDVRANVATFGPTSRRSRESYFQRCDIGNQRRDVPESGNSNIETLRSNVATFLRVAQNHFANVVTLQRG